MAKKIVTFGAILLRLQTPGYQRFIQAQSLDATYGGGEANVAVSLANYGMDTEFVTRLPKNPIGEACLASLRMHNVGTSHIARGGERLGIYYVEKGASQRASNVVYDRAHSAISEADLSDFDWDAIFDGADWFHFTGITPAISPSCAEITLAALKAAKAKGVQVSCDLNFRKKLWTSEEAGRVMGHLMEYVDVCIANEEDAEKVFGIAADNTNITSPLSRGSPPWWGPTAAAKAISATPFGGCWGNNRCGRCSMTAKIITSPKNTTSLSLTAWAAATASAAA